MGDLFAQIELHRRCSFSSRVLTSSKPLFAATGFLVLGLRATFWC